MSRVDVLGVEFDDLTMDEAVAEAMKLIDEAGGQYVVTPNPEIVMTAKENEKLSRALSEAALVLPDGSGVVKAASILGTPMKCKVPGIDFASKVMEKLAQRGGSVYLFGAKPGVAERAGEELKARYPGLVISGCSDGYFKDDAPIKEKISEAKPDLLLVCLGAPKQELWMNGNRGLAGVGLMAGLGGSLDVFAGEVKRAPESWRRLNLEWLYRVIKEPKRIGRVIKLPLFLVEAGAKRLKNGKAGQ